MGVARHEHLLIFLAQKLQAVKKMACRLCYPAQLIAHEQLEVYEHLVVARASGVDFLSEVAVALGEHELHLRVYVLNTLFYAEFTAVYGVENLAQPLEQCVEFILFEQPYRLEHCYMGHGALHVVARQLQVEFAILSYGEFLYHFVGLKALVPEFHVLSCMVFARFPSRLM